MAFVKLDCGILDSTLWFHKACRDVFITALLMARPFKLNERMAQIDPESLTQTGFMVPPGEYGFVEAAGIGILNRAHVEADVGMLALKQLGEPESDSRTPAFDGRRLVRVDGGYIVLNFAKYRTKDHTAAQRAKRYRDRQSVTARNGRHAVTPRNVTQAEAEAEAEADQERIKPQGRYLFNPPSREELNLHASKIGLPVTEVDKFVNFYESKGWMVGKSKMKSWPHSMSGWKVRWEETRKGAEKPREKTIAEKELERLCR